MKPPGASSLNAVVRAYARLSTALAMHIRVGMADCSTAWGYVHPRTRRHSRAPCAHFSAAIAMHIRVGLLHFSRAIRHLGVL
eukprot:3022169-Rhodomonas_salina.1